jgi:hypothetical protein
VIDVGPLERQRLDIGETGRVRDRCGQVPSAAVVDGRCRRGQSDQLIANS